MDLFADVKARVLEAIGQLAAQGKLPEGLDLGAVTVEPPRDPAHGDMATNAAMVLPAPRAWRPATSPKPSPPSSRPPAASPARRWRARASSTSGSRPAAGSG